MNIPDVTSIRHRYLTGIINQDKRFESKKIAWISASEVDGNVFCSWLKIICSYFWKPVSVPISELNESLNDHSINYMPYNQFNYIQWRRLTYLFLSSGILKRSMQRFTIKINLNKGENIYFCRLLITS